MGKEQLKDRLKNARKKLKIEKENPQTAYSLLKFLVVIEINTHYLKRQIYIKLLEYFLANEINVDYFSSYFVGIY